ncbi:hypothetical protein [Caballeronia ptereochthonis]|uniref:Uncharacterized protein n=1 Tax=Caballeronia ptereochthonis TaxID=1777144 RepID=A0A157ZP73_9BURK|nr:hypothetical protein [Caballeronia ptereochthonis]SAK47302.1 hypothetical protein AWB83_00834 [Caballeronia ptereochthonis]
MSRWTWELRRAQWRLGIFGVLAVLIALGAAIIALVDIVPLRADITARRHGLDARAASLKQPPPPAADEAVAPVSADQRYFVFLHSLHAIAAKNGMIIPQISYQVATERDSSVKRYLVEGSFQATYPQLRGFIGALRRLPGTRCERLTMTRADIGATQLEVRLQCAFLVEAAK